MDKHNTHNTHFHYIYIQYMTLYQATSKPTEFRLVEFAGFRITTGKKKKPLYFVYSTIKN